MFNADDIKAIQKHNDVETIKDLSKQLVKDSTTSEVKKERLYKNIDSKQNKYDVIAILYNMLLAGEGLYTYTSKWSAR